MDFLNLLTEYHSSVQALIVISIVCAIGLSLGKIRFGSISLGVAFVFFTGIVAGHFGLSIDGDMLIFAENFGLVLFVYALGLQVGPGFFSSMRHGGVRLNMLGLFLAIIGLAVTVLLTYVTAVSLPDLMGLFCGATTNTPALGAVQATLTQLGIPSSTPALGCAVAYPLGVVGVIVALIIIRRLWVTPERIDTREEYSTDKPVITEFEVCNPGICGKTIAEIAHVTNMKFVISRLWREGIVKIPTSGTTLRKGDHLLVISSPADVQSLGLIFGEQEQEDWNRPDIDWDTIDRQLVSRSVIVTRHNLNGQLLGSLKLRNLYGINISRVYRSGVPLLATPDLRLQLGDRLTIVGETEAVTQVEEILGNAVDDLDEPNLVAVFIGIVLGLLLGSVPLSFPGIAAPVKIGLAGGPIVMGIIIGTFGPRLHMAIYTTPSANRMLRAIGLTLFLACLGLDSGANFFETVFRAEGILWISIGLLLTIVPTMIIGIIALKILKLDYATTAGLLCGSMANPMALEYANSTVTSDSPSVAYATVYPVSMFARVILVQLAILLFL
ncbi:MAG: putative transporter [Muribaculum sp.]|nr:putative transporter [Muribaculum sp.]